MYAIYYKEINKELSLEENFIEAMRLEVRNARRDYFKNLSIYTHLFEMLKYYVPNFLEQAKEEYKESEDWWFYNFHKQFRQVDMFDGMGFYGPKLSEEGQKKRDELLRERDVVIRKHRPSHKDFPNEDEWQDKLEEFYAKNEELNEIREKLKPLNKLYHAYEMKEPFCGHMDMVMWETISNDKDGSLYRFMDEFLAMYHGVRSYEDKKLFPEENKDESKK